MPASTASGQPPKIFEKRHRHDRSGHRRTRRRCEESQGHQASPPIRLQTLRACLSGVGLHAYASTALGPYPLVSSPSHLRLVSTVPGPECTPTDANRVARGERLTEPASERVGRLQGPAPARSSVLRRTLAAALGGTVSKHANSCVAGRPHRTGSVQVLIRDAA